MIEYNEMVLDVAINTVLTDFSFFIATDCFISLPSTIHVQHMFHPFLGIEVPNNILISVTLGSFYSRVVLHTVTLMPRELIR